MKQYLEVLDRIMKEGVERRGRNGVTKALFTVQMRFKMRDGFPAVTTKKLAFKAVKGELLWFLEGSGDDNRLKAIMGTDRTIWTDNAQAPYWKPNAKFDGDLGRVYGVQWRKWQNYHGETFDQMKTVIERLKTDPTDRRLVVTAWNPGELQEMALPPCHMIFQFFAANGKLSLHMLQRSCDMFLGVPFNITSYSLLLHMVAQVAGMEADECILTLGDAHIYDAHYDAVREQLSRAPYPLPRLVLNPAVRDIDGFKMEDIALENYQSHPTIKAPMMV